LVGKPEGKRPLEDIGVDGKIIVEWILEKLIEWIGMYWMHLTQDRDQWQALANMVINLWVL
jgi:hypothetical protein